MSINGFRVHCCLLLLVVSALTLSSSVLPMALPLGGGGGRNGGGGQSSKDSLVSVRVRENRPVGTVICTLSDLIIPRPSRNTEFSLSKNSFFAIEAKDKLVVHGLIDRDQNPRLCLSRPTVGGGGALSSSSASSSPASSCAWRSFLVSSVGSYHVLEVHVLDENDNVPRWPQSHVTIEVTENTPVDSFQLELPKANDFDDFPNDILLYKIEPVSKFFYMAPVRSSAGLRPLLKLKKTVDRELISWHNVTVLAVDGGVPAETGTLQLFVRILDVNDNTPVFESSLYRRSLEHGPAAGNATAAPLDLGIRATDLDADANGNITYHFSLDVSFAIQSCFELDPVDAVIRVRRPLVGPCYQPEYRFSVTAADHGHPVKSSKTSVVLFMKNRNVHPPKIMLSNNDPHIYVRENSEPPIQLITGAVQDKDLDRNGEFRCFLVGANASEVLLRSNKTRMEDTTIISLVTNQIFDREQVPKLYVSIVCRDLGEPPLQSSVDIFITILDTNDNEPRFEKPFHRIKIYEENQPNYRVAQLDPRDLDAANNARLDFRLEWERNKYNLEELLLVDSRCQIIAKRSLDRERFPEGFKLQVIATDHGQPPRSGSTLVHIELMDINDHPPVFEKAVYNLTFTEDFGSKQKRRIVDFILAKDADFKENAVVTYSLSSDALLPFKLDSVTGELFNYILVDRETQPTHYLFTVFAMDNPSNLLYRKTATASVSITIEDFNDNEPVFLFPNEANHEVKLSYLVPIGTLVTTVKAYDKDYGQNSKLIFSLVDAERNILFSLNESSGQLVTSTVLNAMHEGVENLFVRATDCGVPRLTSIQRLTVILGDFKMVDSTILNDNNGHRESFLSDQATFIIVGIILGTFFICCGLVTGICTMAYRRWHRSHNMSTVTQLYQVGDELTNIQYIDNYLIMKEIT